MCTERMGRCVNCADWMSSLDPPPGRRRRPVVEPHSALHTQGHGAWAGSEVRGMARAWLG